MAPIRTNDAVFLGVVVNPKTSAPIFVQRKSWSQMTVQIMGLGQQEDAGNRVYTSLGDGYLNDDREYAGPTDVTGYPRSHTPHGVTEKGGGYGTCLYTGLVLLASAHFRDEISIQGLLGKGAGICSEENTRSDPATRWWRASLRRGITQQMSGDTEGDEPSSETEELEDEDVDDYVSRRDWRKIEEVIQEAVSNHGSWSIRNLRVRADLEREVENDDSDGGEHITADYYTLLSATRHNLVAVIQTRQGGMLEWGRDPGPPNIAYKETILGLNVGGQDSLLVAKLALIASQNGATETELADMMIRSHLGADIVSRRMLFDSGEQLGLPVVTAPRLGDQVGGRRKRKRPPEREPGAKEPPQENPPHIIARRNPTTPSIGEMKQLERSLKELERRREDLGWNELRDLP